MRLNQPSCQPIRLSGADSNDIGFLLLIEIRENPS